MVIKEKFWTETQLPRLEELAEEYGIPRSVVDEIQKTVRILDRNYGKNRDVDQEDGGFVLLLLSENEEAIKKAYDAVLQKYVLQRELAEFEDVISQDGERVWYIELYLPASEYGITIIYPDGSGVKNG